jgi:hypothetical protein
MLGACVFYVSLALIALYVVWLAKYKPMKTVAPAAVSTVTEFKVFVKPYVSFEFCEEVRQPEPKAQENRQPRFVDDGSFVINFKSSRSAVPRPVLSHLNPNSNEFSPVDEQARLNPEATDFKP